MEDWEALSKKYGVTPPSTDPKKPRQKSPYDELFEDSGRRHGVDPDLLRAMTKQESTFDPKATSPKNAQGLMQLIPSTAKRFKVANPYDPKQNIEGGAQYMRFLLDRFGGDVDKALAGYNTGEGAVDKYKGIPPYRETQDYVKKIRGNYGGGGYYQRQNNTDFTSLSEKYLGGTGDIGELSNKYLTSNTQKPLQMPGQPLAQDAPVSKDTTTDFTALTDKYLGVPTPTNPANTQLKVGVPQIAPATQLEGETPLMYGDVREQRSSAPNAGYAEFLAQTGLPDTPESIAEFNLANRASVEGANAQNRKDAEQVQQRKQIAQQLKTARQGQQQQQSPPASESDGLTIETDVTGKTEDDIFDEMAAKISAQTGAAHPAVKAYLKKAGLVTVSDNAPVTKEHVSALAKNRLAMQTRFSAEDLQKIAAAGQAYGQDEEKLTTARQQLLSTNPGLEATPEILEVMAGQQAGLLSKNKGDQLLLQKRNDYIDWLVAKGYAEEDAVKKAFGITDPDSDKPISALEWAWIKNPLHALFATNKSHVPEQIKNDVTQDILQYGSLSEAVKEYKRQDAEREFNQAAGVGNSGQAIKTAGRYIAKIPATLIETGAILADANPILAGYEIATDQSTGVRESLMSAAEDWRNRIDRDLALQQNPAYKNDFIANEVAEGLTQLAVQLTTAPLTGGLSLAFPMAEGATATYREADKAGANRAVRLTAATVAAGLAVPEVLLRAKYLNAFSGRVKLNILEKMTGGLFAKFSKLMGEQEARELTKVTVGSFIKSGIAHGIFGTGGEYTQERLEDVGNKALAKATYKPNITWEDVFVPTSQEQRGYYAAGIAGAFGGSVETAIEQMSDAELQKGADKLSELLAQDRITKATYERLLNKVIEQQAVRKETKNTQPDEVSQPTAPMAPGEAVPAAEVVPSETAIGTPTSKAPAQATDKTETSEEVPATTEKPAVQDKAVAPDTATEPQTISHPNPAIDGKPIIAETADGKVVVANPENKSGISLVKNRAPLTKIERRGDVEYDDAEFEEAVPERTETQINPEPAKAPKVNQESAKATLSAESKPKEPWEMTKGEWDALSGKEQDKMHGRTVGGINPSHSNYHITRVLGALRKGENVPRKVLDDLDDTKIWDASQILKDIEKGATFPQTTVDWVKDTLSSQQQAAIRKEIATERQRLIDQGLQPEEIWNISQAPKSETQAEKPLTSETQAKEPDLGNDILTGKRLTGVGQFERNKFVVDRSRSPEDVRASLQKAIDLWKDPKFEGRRPEGQRLLNRAQTAVREYEDDVKFGRPTTPPNPVTPSTQAKDVSAKPENIDTSKAVANEYRNAIQPGARITINTTFHKYPDTPPRTATGIVKKVYKKGEFDLEVDGKLQRFLVPKTARRLADGRIEYDRGDISTSQVAIQSDESENEPKPEVYHLDRPAIVLNTVGNRSKIQYLDGKKETPTVLTRKLSKEAPAKSLDQPAPLEFLPHSYKMLRQKQNQDRLRKQGFDFYFTGAKRGVALTKAPEGFNPGDFEQRVYETNADRVQERKVGTSKPKATGPQSLSQFVRSSGGIRATRGDRGEVQRLSNKESGSSGLVNQNGKYDAEMMAFAAWELGYLRDVWTTREDVNGNEFMVYVEEDMSGERKRYAMDAYEELDRTLEDQEAEYYAQRDDKAKAEEEYQRQLDAMLTKQGDLLTDPANQELLAKVSKKGEYQVGSALGEPLNETSSAFQDLLERYGISADRFANDIIEAYIAQQASEETEAESSESPAESKPQRDNEKRDATAFDQVDLFGFEEPPATIRRTARFDYDKPVFIGIATRKTPYTHEVTEFGRLSFGQWTPDEFFDRTPNGTLTPSPQSRSLGIDHTPSGGSTYLQFNPDKLKEVVTFVRELGFNAIEVPVDTIERLHEGLEKQFGQQTAEAVPVKKNTAFDQTDLFGNKQTPQTSQTDLFGGMEPEAKPEPVDTRLESIIEGIDRQAKRFGDTPAINDARRAAGLYSKALQTKSPIQAILDQQNLFEDGKTERETASKQAVLFAEAMYRGDFPQVFGEALIKEGNANGSINYEQVKDVAGRVGSGSLEIVRLDRQAERGRIAGGQRNVEKPADARTNESTGEASSTRSGKRVDSQSARIRDADSNIAKSIPEGFDPKQFEAELAKIEPVKNADGKLLAPNGNVSNLQNERLWKTVRTPQFINFFGDWINDPENASKVVDENGEPLVMYHGTPTSGFLSFDKGKIGAKSNTAGIHFTDSRAVAASYAGTRDEYIPPTKWKDAGLTVEYNENYNQWGVYDPDGNDLAYAESENAAKEEAQALIDNGEYEPESPGIYAGFVNLRNSQKTNQYSQDIDLRGGSWSGEIFYNEKIDKYTSHDTSYEGRLERKENDEGVDTYYTEDGTELGEFVAFDINDLIKQAKDMDDKGIIVRNVYDDGGEMGSQYSAGDSTQAIIFDSENFKSLHNRGTFDPNEDSILKSIPSESTPVEQGQPMFRRADEIDAAKDDLANARTIPLKELTGMVENTISHAGEGVVEILDVPGYEMTRRLVRGYEKLHTPNVEGSDFSGLTFDNKTQTKKFLKFVIGKLNDAQARGIDTTAFESYVNAIKEAAKTGRGLIFIWNDAALSEELLQRSFGELRLGGRSKQVSKPILDSLTASEPFKRAMSGKLGRLYKGYAPHALAEEFAAKALLGQYDEISANTEAEKVAAAVEAVKFLRSFAEVNTREGMSADDILNYISNEVTYAKEAREELARRESVQANEAESQRTDEGSSRPDADTGRSREEDRGDEPQGSSERDSDVEQRLASLPQTLRKYGIDAVDTAYTVYKDTEATADAVEMFQNNGIDGSIKLLDNIKDPDASHTILAGIVYDTLLNASFAAQGANAQALRAKADEFIAKTSLKLVKAGQRIRAVQLMQHAPTVTVLSTAINITDGNISPEDVADLTDLARELEAAFAETQMYKKQSEQLRKENKKLEKKLKNALADKLRRRAARGRMQIFNRVQDLYGAEIEKAARLVGRMLRNDEIAKMVAPTSDTDIGKQIPDTDTELIDALGTIGASHLIRGLAGDTDFLPETFKAVMEAQVGNIDPIFNAVYKKSLEIRDKWLKDIAKENAKKTVSRKLEDQKFEAEMEKALNRKLPERLTENDILDILGVTRNIVRRQRAIEKMHRLATGVRKTNVPNEMRQMILGLSANDGEAVAAQMIAESRDPNEIEAALKEQGYDVKTSFIRGKEIVDRAKREIKDHQAEIEQSVAELTPAIQDAAVAEIRARERLQLTKQRIADKYEKLKTPKTFYVKKAYRSGMDLLRNLTLSAEMSFLMRQGGKAIRSESVTFPARKVQEMRGKATRSTTPPPVRGMLKTLLPQTQATPNWGEAAYATNVIGVEHHPAYAEAVKMGIDFSTAGKLGMGMRVGEEQLQSEALDRIVDWLNKHPVLNNTVGLWPRGIQHFDKAMAVFLDNMRLRLYDRFSTQLKEQGYTVKDDRAEFEELARRVNTMTSRPNRMNGPTQKLVDAAVESRLFLAPSYTVAKWQDMGADTRNVVTAVAKAAAFQGLPKGTQKIMLKRAMASYGALAAQYALLAYVLGALVSFDPDDDDFLKLKLGKYRYDLTQGNRAELRYIAQLIKNRDASKASNSTGKYLRTRLNVVPGFALNAWMGKDVAGKDFSLKDPKRWAGLVAPLTYMNAIGAYQQDGWSGVGGTLPFDFIGYGATVYPDRMKDLKLQLAEAQRRGDTKEVQRIENEIAIQEPIEQAEKQKRDLEASKKRAAQYAGTPLAEMMESPQIKSWTTDDWVTFINETPDLSFDELQQAKSELEKKANNAYRGGTLTPDELSRIRAIMPYSPSKKRVPEKKPKLTPYEKRTRRQEYERSLQ